MYAVIITYLLSIYIDVCLLHYNDDWLSQLVSGISVCLQTEILLVTIRYIRVTSGDVGIDFKAMVSWDGHVPN